MKYSDWEQRMLSLAKSPLRKIRRVARRHRRSLKNEVFESQWLTEDLLQERQLLHIRKLLAHAYNTTRYYRELLDSMGLQVKDIQSLSDFSRLVPILDKRIMRERFEDLVSSEWKGKCDILQTSGSTGTPTKFAHPRPYRMQGLSLSLSREICGLKGGERAVVLWGADLGDGRYYTFDKERNRAVFSFYSLPAHGFEELLEYVVDLRPEFVMGYVSVLYTVAQELEKRGYASLGARIIRTHAEKLYDHQRETLQRVFGGEVFQHYGSREITDLGIECQEHQGLHLLSNLRFFELEPIDNRDNRTGEVLVTDFANYAMPLIRYRIGDVLTIDNKPCACGRSLPRAWIEGRTIDLIRLRDGTTLFSVFFERLMDPKQVNRFLVHQRSFDRIDVHIVPTDSFTDNYRNFLIQEIRNKTNIEDIKILLEEEIDVIIANKYRLVRSDISAQTENRRQ